MRDVRWHRMGPAAGSAAHLPELPRMGLLVMGKGKPCTFPGCFGSGWIYVLGKNRRCPRCHGSGTC